MRRLLDDNGLVAEFQAPRLSEHPWGRTDRSRPTRPRPSPRRRPVETCHRHRPAAGHRYIVLWPAREGTYLREAKDPVAGGPHRRMA